jgi:hypothetical protein
MPRETKYVVTTMRPLFALEINMRIAHPRTVDHTVETARSQYRPVRRMIRRHACWVTLFVIAWARHRAQQHSDQSCQHRHDLTSETLYCNACWQAHGNELIACATGASFAASVAATASVEPLREA